MTTTTTDHEIEINVYRAAGTWHAAIWIDSEYDSSDALDIEDTATTREAIEAALAMPLRVAGRRAVRKVDDI